MNKSRVIDLVVQNDLCIGCGLCVYACTSNALEMRWNEYGFLVAHATGDCNCNGACLNVCPFNPFPKDTVKSENELAEEFLKEPNNYHKKIGKYLHIYAGYSTRFRLSSSSGGLGTYICDQLLQKNIVNHIFSVKESAQPGIHYEYSVSSTSAELLSSSKTRYFPVTMANVFSEIDQLDGKIAIVGVGCFIKAIRLAQHHDSRLKEKIVFLVGIICGGVKSTFFTEYLASKVGVAAPNVRNPDFRKKDFSRTAFDYSFSCSNGIEEKSIRMRSVGDMWGTGMFKANACDFCDDVTTELADISLGDAWLDPYDADGKGTNVIVTRSMLAEQLIADGIKTKELVAEFLPLERFLVSQQGSFNHRHLGMPTRIKRAKKKGIPVPPKRYEKNEATLDFRRVQKQRMKVRAKSLRVWKDTAIATTFDEQMQKSLTRLAFYTKIYHERRRIMNLNRKFWQKVLHLFDFQSKS